MDRKASVKLFWWNLTRWIALGIIISCSSCQSDAPPAAPEDPLEYSLSRAGDNRDELEKVIQHYSREPVDSLKLEAALFLIANLYDKYFFTGNWMDTYLEIVPSINHLSGDEYARVKDSLVTHHPVLRNREVFFERDARHLRADYLMDHIEMSFDNWRSAPWHGEVSFETFKNFILPYKVDEEAIQEWVPQYRRRYGKFVRDIEQPDLVTAVSRINSQLRQSYQHNINLGDYPGRGPEFLSLIPQGNCIDMTNLAIYAMRAQGIPVAMDFSPAWGNFSEGHSWNALITSDTTFLQFMGAESNPRDYFPADQENRPSKIWRKLYEINENSFGYLTRNAPREDIPFILQDMRRLDVTEHYVQTSNIELTVSPGRHENLYLCTFDGTQWQPIAGTAIREDGSAKFENMGLNVMYLPAFYRDGEVIPAGSPLYVDYHTAVLHFVEPLPSTSEIIVNKTVPISRMGARFGMVGNLWYGFIEVARDELFRSAESVYSVDEYWLEFPDHLNPPVGKDQIRLEDLWLEVRPSVEVALRYLRFVDTTHSFLRIGEMEVYDENGMKIIGEPIGSIPNPEAIADGPGGEWLNIEKKGPAWVGFDFGKPVKISKVRLLPWNGDNAVHPQGHYQLLYWDDAWKSLGVVEAESTQLTFGDVPDNCLFWLRNLDNRNNRDRIFTYEDGRQIWW